MPPSGNPTFTQGYTYTQTAPGFACFRVGDASGIGLNQIFMSYTLTPNAVGANPALMSDRSWPPDRDTFFR